MSGPTASPPIRPWWHDAVVYQVYVRSFADSDGDGIGDLDGVRARLDHLSSLGVDAIWLNPCYPSPQRDHGYVVPNHCSSEHRWFRAALEAGPGSPERARFFFRDGVGDGPPNNWRAVFGG